SYKYFHPVKDHIRELFNFHPKIKDTVEVYGAKLFANDMDSHKMCVHIRRGDFIEHELLETRSDFLVPAMTTVKNFIFEKYPEKNISLVFLTNDWEFVNSLDFDESGFLKIYCPKIKSRGENMYFGSRFCDSILLSSSGSTFGFWIAYLMPDSSLVFYNGQIDKVRGSGNFSKEYVDYDGFPKDWNILELDKRKKIVTIDNRWFFEKFGLNYISSKNFTQL
ncbi:hypothetical protein FO519_010574, partial [Halicephalobus sp. NKZ332]